MLKTQRLSNIPQTDGEARVKKEGWLSLLLVACILALVVYPSSRSTRGRLGVGDISSVDIKAPTEISVVDDAASDKLRQEALAKVLPVYTLNDDILNGASEGIEDLFGQIRLLKGKVIVSDEEVSDLQESLKVDIPFTVLTAIVTQLEVNRVEEGSKRLVEHILGRGVVEDSGFFSLEEQQRGILITEKTDEGELTEVKDVYDLKNLLGGIDRGAAFLFPDLDNDHLFAIKVVTRNFIQPNLEYNESETNRRGGQELDKVAPVTVSMKRGEMIVREGERLAPRGALILKALYASERKAVLVSALSLAVLVVASLLVIFIYISKHHPILVRDQSRVLLLVITLTIVVGLARLISSNDEIANTLIPAAAGAILIALLLDLRAAALTLAAASLLGGLTAGYDLTITLQILVGGVAGIYSVRDLRRLRDLFGAGFMVALANTIVIVSAGLILESSLVEIVRNSLWGLGAGALTSLLAVGLLPLLERLFGFATDIRLTRLGRFSAPLLARMRSKAPGTYEHSLRVAELSEAAACAIGANPLLAKVGSYYLDIGKSKRPAYFLENRVDGNRDEHEKLSPSMASLVIISHVRDGVEMAGEHRLPRAIVNIIKQHHGSAMISGLYERAVEEGDADSVKESDYRYPGPKPKTREAGIVMLADSVGAASRNLISPLPSRIAFLVKKIVNNKFIEGQLDESNLTLQDIKKINEAFLQVLTAIFYLRPESGKKEGATPTEVDDEDSDKQQDLNQNKKEVLVESS